MKIIAEKTEYKLSAEAIDKVSAEAGEFLTALKTQRKNIIASRIAIEEVLLDLRDKFGEDATFTFVKSKFLSTPFISVELSGEEFNPLIKDGDDEFGNWTSSLMANAEYTPVYSYSRGKNVITVKFEQPSLNPFFKLLFASLAAVAASLLKLVLPQGTISQIEEIVLTPLYEMFLGMMEAVEMPLVFFSVACGIVGIGDREVFGTIGRRMVVRFITVTLAFSAVGAAAFALLFDTQWGSSRLGYGIKGGIDMLFDIVPHSVIEPFVSGNAMQVVFLGVIFGLALIVLGEKTKTLAKCVDEANRVMVYVTELVTKLVPLFVFVGILQIAWSGSLHLFIGMLSPLAAYIAVCAAAFCAVLAYVCVRFKVKAVTVVKKISHSFIIALTTASSAAAVGESADCMEHKLGINGRFVEIGHSVGDVLYMPATAVNFAVVAIYMASVNNVQISLLWLVIAVMICAFVAVVTPPVTGGAIAAYSVIFLQLGIPVSALAVVISFDIIFDFIATAFDGAFLKLELVIQAAKNDLLSVEKLRKQG